MLKNTFQKTNKKIKKIMLSNKLNYQLTRMNYNQNKLKNNHSYIMKNNHKFIMKNNHKIITKSNLNMYIKFL